MIENLPEIKSGFHALSDVEARINKEVEAEIAEFNRTIQQRLDRMRTQGQLRKKKADAVRMAIMNLENTEIPYTVSCYWTIGADITINVPIGRKGKDGLRPIDRAIMETRRAIGTSKFTESKSLKDDGAVEVTLSPSEPELSSLYFKYTLPKLPKGEKTKCRIVTTKRLVCEID